MRKTLILLQMIILCEGVFAQNVGIGTACPDDSAKLDIVDTQSGV